MAFSSSNLNWSVLVGDLQVRVSLVFEDNFHTAQDSVFDGGVQGRAVLASCIVVLGSLFEQKLDDVVQASPCCHLKRRIFSVLSRVRVRSRTKKQRNRVIIVIGYCSE